MKSLITIPVLLLAFAANAQLPYRPLPTSGAEWVERHQRYLFDTGGLSGTITCDRIITSGADSLIGSVLYHRLRTQGTCIEPPFVTVEPLTDLLFFRDDPVERKVYAYNVTTQSEELFMDFSAVSLEYPGTHPMTDLTLYVWATDSLDLTDGWHRQVVLAYDPQAQLPITALIEGVGATSGMNVGPDGIAPPPFVVNVLRCHSVDGVVIYSGDGSCELTTSIPSIDRTVLRVQPNPVVDEAIIIGLPNSNVRYEVFDAMGAQFAAGSFVRSRLDCGSWQAGVYIIHLRDAEGRSIGALRMIKT